MPVTNLGQFTLHARDDEVAIHSVDRQVGGARQEGIADLDLLESEQAVLSRRLIQLVYGCDKLVDREHTVDKRIHGDREGAYDVPQLLIDQGRGDRASDHDEQAGTIREGHE